AGRPLARAAHPQGDDMTSSAFGELASSLRDVRVVGAVLAAGLAVALSAHALSAAPVRPAIWLGPRGLQRQRARANSELFAITEPLLRWLGTRLSGTLPSWLVARVERRLVRAGDLAGLAAEEYAALQIGAGLAGALAGALYVLLNDADGSF